MSSSIAIEPIQTSPSLRPGAESTDVVGAVASPSPFQYSVRPLRLSLIIWALRWILRPWTARVIRGGAERIAAAQ